MTVPVLARYDNWWWPADDRNARPVLTRDCEPTIAALLPHVSGRDVAVQAGGNVGLFPVELAKHFTSVVTFEPDPVNYECLLLNLYQSSPPRNDRIRHRNAALGDGEGWCDPVVVEAGNCGAHRVDFKSAMQPGSVRVTTIDSLHLDACNLIFLDIEGAELMALIGATDTIERFGPTIALEDKGHHRSFGIPDGELQRWLTAQGYSEVARLGNDKVFKR